MWHGHHADQRVWASGATAGKIRCWEIKRYIDLGEYWIGVRVLAARQGVDWCRRGEQGTETLRGVIFVRCFQPRYAGQDR